MKMHKRLVSSTHTLFIFLPCLLAAFYWGLYASDRYVSESKFVVKQSGMEQPTGLDVTSILSGGGSASKDSLMIGEYIHSADLLGVLDKELNLREHFSSTDIDVITRLSTHASKEDFLQFYRKRVNVEYDELSSVVTVTVQAFNPPMAQSILQSIVLHSEQFTNAIGHRMAQEQVDFVSAELARNHDALRDAKQEIVAFQNEHELFSPESESISLSTTISGLERRLAEKEATQKSLSTYLNQKAPELTRVQAEISSLQKQIKVERSRLAGTNGSVSLNNLGASFQNLQMNVEFGSDIYRSTLTALETARIEAIRKLKYLVLLETAGLPDEALYPRRLYNFTTFIVFSLMLYWVGRLVVATIKDHRD